MSHCQAASNCMSTHSLYAVDWRLSAPAKYDCEHALADLFDDETCSLEPKVMSAAIDDASRETPDIASVPNAPTLGTYG
jgi:hypothetical protein